MAFVLVKKFPNLHDRGVVGTAGAVIEASLRL